MNVVNFFVDNWDVILLVLIIAIGAVISVKKGENTILRQICFSLVTKAEQEFGAGVGVLKYAAVADMLYQRIPTVLKIFYTSKDIEKMIESTLAEAKKKWINSDNLQKYINQPQTAVDSIKESVTSIAETAIKTAVENGTTAIIESTKQVLETAVTQKSDE
jgi:hypothetical protein